MSLSSNILTIPIYKYIHAHDSQKLIQSHHRDVLIACISQQVDDLCCFHFDVHGFEDLLEGGVVDGADGVVIEVGEELRELALFLIG